jgi:AbrB family looped-hinge helix DNA binding protein
MVYAIDYTMKVEIPMDGAGRLVLPKVLRRQFDLHGGDVLEVESMGSEMRLRPKRGGEARLVREGKRLVWDVPGVAVDERDIADSLRRGREERDRRAAAWPGGA